jgi:hypothetical protein
MHVSVNDSCVLRLLRVYKKNHNSMVFLIYRRGCQDGIPPYIFSDKGFPCISWPMTHCKGGCHFFIEMFNGKHKCGHFVVENTFGILKTF